MELSIEQTVILLLSTQCRSEKRGEGEAEDGGDAEAGVHPAEDECPLLLAGVVGGEAVDADGHAHGQRLHHLLRPQERQRQDLEVGVVEVVHRVGQDETCEELVAKVKYGWSPK